jgi:alpha 1,3-glucosidase
VIIQARGPNKKYEEPYRLYNFDVFEYELNSPMALYGSIPYMTVHNANRDLGFLWFNSAEMWVDVERDANSIHSHWMVESGQMDVFLLLGPNSNQIQLQLKALTGSPAMPQLFATAYHQCRWNYNDEEDVANVNAKFDDFNIPYDVLWLDIEHTIGKQYFTWDAAKFPNPEKMQESLASSGRKV